MKTPEELEYLQAEMKDRISRSLRKVRRGANYYTQANVQRLKPELYQTQKGLCDCCLKEIKLYSYYGGRIIPRSIAGHVDHDHRTGNIRALVCASCNAIIGHIERAGFVPCTTCAQRLMALDYVDRHTQRQLDEKSQKAELVSIKAESVISK